MIRHRDRSPRRWVAGLALVTALLVPVVAQAKKPEKSARAIAEEGLAHHQAGEYDEAIEDFERAFALAPDPALVFNIAVAYRKKGDCPHALEQYEKYLLLMPSLKAADREKVEERIDQMKTCVEQERREAQAREREKVAPPPPPPQGTAGTEAPRTSALPLVVGGSGALLAATGGALLFLSNSRFRDLEEDCSPFCDPERYDGMETRTIVANVLLIGGAVAVATGGALWYLQWRQPATDRGRAYVVPAPGGLVVGGTF